MSSGFVHCSLLVAIGNNLFCRITGSLGASAAVGYRKGLQTLLHFQNYCTPAEWSALETGKATNQVVLLFLLLLLLLFLFLVLLLLLLLLVLLLMLLLLLLLLVLLSLGTCACYKPGRSSCCCRPWLHAVL